MFQILADLSYIIKRKHKIIVIYSLLWCFLLYMLYKAIYKSDFIDYEYINYILNQLFALDIHILSSADIFVTVMNLLHYLFFIYISLSLFVKDYDLFDNYFTRITYRKWFLYKIFINLILILFFHLILYLFVLCINYQLLPLIVLGKKILFLLNIIIYVYIIMNYFYKNKILTLLLSVIGIIPFMFHITIRTINMSILLISSFILIMFVIFNFRKKRFSDLEIERGMSWK